MVTAPYQLNAQRKAALAHGGAIDHAGEVQVVPRHDFDMSRTIFNNMHGFIPRLFMTDKLAKQAYWREKALIEVERAYTSFQEGAKHEELNPDLVQFMVDECNFSMEHADGSFLEHLYFCYVYASQYYPEHSANIALLHSILGTATNTFAMGAEKLPKLKERLTEAEYVHIQLFPTILRLLYDQQLIPNLRDNLHRIDKLCALRCHRVIDNAPLTVDADALWINLNFHLMHFVDFMPIANWSWHQSDPLLQQFRELSNFLDEANQRHAQTRVSFPDADQPPTGEVRTLIGRVSAAIPLASKMSLARKTIQRYSREIGHSLAFELEFQA